MRYGIRGCIPALMKRADGSFSGIKEAEEMMACPLFSKKSKNLFLISSDFIERRGL
jgi:hypothetical protein